MITKFRSIEEIEKVYFPAAYFKKQWYKMTPEQKGKYLANETMNKIKEWMSLYE